MNCNEAYPLIQDYVDGALAPREAKALEAHAGGCATCRSEIRAFEALTGALARLESEAPPAGFGDLVIERLRSAGRIAAAVPGVMAARRGLFSRVRPAYRAAVAVVAVVVLATLVPVALRSLGVAAGKVAVIGTDAYMEVEDKVSGLGRLTGLFDGFERNLRTVHTILRAAFSLLVAAGETYLPPVIAALVALSLGLAWLIRSTQRRDARHASVSF